MSESAPSGLGAALPKAAAGAGACSAGTSASSPAAAGDGVEFGTVARGWRGDRFLVLCFAKDLAALAKGCLFPDLWSRAEPTTLRTRSLSGRVPDEAKASDEGSGEGASSQAGRVPSHDDTRGPALSLPSVPHNLTQSPEREFRFTFLLAFPLLGWTTKQVVDALLATLTTTPTRMDASRACVEVLLAWAYASHFVEDFTSPPRKSSEGATSSPTTAGHTARKAMHQLLQHLEQTFQTEKQRALHAAALDMITTKLHECAAVDVSRDSSSRAQQRTADRSTSTATSTPGPLRRFRKFLSSRFSSSSSSRAPATPAWPSLGHSTIPSRELAIQITLVMQAAFQSVPPRQVLSYAQCGCLHAGCALVKPLVEQFDRVCFWVATEILNTRFNAKQRSVMIQRWIQVAEECLRIRNYNAVFAIALGLSAHYVARLATAWGLLSRSVLDRFKALTTFTASASNFKEYRKALFKVPASSPMLPAVFVSLKDVVAASNVIPRPLAGGDDFPDSVKAGIKFAKWTQIAHFASGLLRCQTYAYSQDTSASNSASASASPGWKRDAGVAVAIQRCLDGARGPDDLNLMSVEAGRRENAALEESLEEAGFF